MRQSTWALAIALLAAPCGLGGRVRACSTVPSVAASGVSSFLSAQKIAYEVVMADGVTINPTKKKTSAMGVTYGVIRCAVDPVAPEEPYSTEVDASKPAGSGCRKTTNLKVTCQAEGVHVGTPQDIYCARWENPPVGCNDQACRDALSAWYARVASHEAGHAAVNAAVAGSFVSSATKHISACPRKGSDVARELTKEISKYIGRVEKALRNEARGRNKTYDRDTGGHKIPLDNYDRCEAARICETPGTCAEGEGCVRRTPDDKNPALCTCECVERGVCTTTTTSLPCGGGCPKPEATGRDFDGEICCQFRQDTSEKECGGGCRIYEPHVPFQEDHWMVACPNCSGSHCGFVSLQCPTGSADTSPSYDPYRCFRPCSENVGQNPGAICPGRGFTCP